MRIIDCLQNTPEWHAARAGKVTGSRMTSIMAKGKNGAPSAMRATYMGELIAERLSGAQAMDGYKSPAMKWGTDNEEAACAMYAFMYDTEPTKVGFVLHPTLDWAGCSPDRLLPQGCMQVKCPNSSTHADTLLGAPIDRAYILQMNWELCCTGTESWEFVSYDPRFPPEMQLHRRRGTRDDTLIKDMEREVRSFLSDVDEKLAELRKMYLSEAKAA